MAPIGRVCSLCWNPCKRQGKLGSRNQFTVTEMWRIRVRHASRSREKIQIGATIRWRVISGPSVPVPGISAALGTVRMTPIHETPCSLRAIAAEITLWVTAKIYFVGNSPFLLCAPTFDFHQLITHTYCPPLGRCHATSRTLFPLSTGERVRISTQLRSIAH